MSLDRVGGEFLVAEVVVPEVVFGIGDDPFESLPGGSGRRIAGELHVEAEEGALGDWTSGEGWLGF